MNMRKNCIASFFAPTFAEHLTVKVNKRERDKGLVKKTGKLQLEPTKNKNHRERIRRDCL